MPNALKDASASPVDLQDFVNALSDMSDCWYKLGMFLLVPEEELHEIKAKHAVDPIIGIYKCMRDTSSVPSWENITQALKKMGKNSLAESLTNKYITKPQETDSADLRQHIEEGMYYY